MFTSKRLLAVILLLPLGGAAQAAGTESSFGLGTRLGITTGLGFEATYGVNRWVDLRGGFNIGYVEFDYEEQETTYLGELSYRSFSGFVDIKPFGGGFRLSAGVYSKPMELELAASGEDEYDLGDRNYFGDLDLDGDVELGSAVPYLGIGWGGTTNGSGLGMSFDLGVQFGDSPDVSLIANGTVCDLTSDPNCTATFDVNDPNDPRAQMFQSELNREIAELEDDAKDFELIPVIQIGLHYRFGGGSSSGDTAPRRAAVSPVAPPVSAPAAAPVIGIAPKAPAAAATPRTQTPPPGSFVTARVLQIKPSPTSAAKPSGIIAAGATVTVKGEQKNNDGDWRFVTSGVQGGWLRASDIP